jgi:hypothetical protein
MSLGATYKEIVNVLVGMVEDKILARGVRDQTDLDVLVLIRCMRRNDSRVTQAPGDEDAD